ncbi:MAG: hypothetical protein J0H29_05130 [Sphingobacteriales bacterium]|nr:hypothetical protein [Sphingobacteriales bacterium]OJY86193.1 MAG: hypothetical protein BGP14_17110 [Sphingobacteriales bacterium 44-15]
MPFIPTSFQVPATITEDMMIINVLDDVLANSPIQYVIEDEKEQVCRKGSFRGLRIQMRIADLQDGVYRLLLKNTETCCSFRIRKASSKWKIAAGVS